MKTFEVSRLSTKGQIVIPTGIRKKLKIDNGTNFAIFTDGSSILLKPIIKPSIAGFDKLIERSHKVIKKSKLTKSNVNKLIRKVRSKNK